MLLYCHQVACDQQQLSSQSKHTLHAHSKIEMFIECIKCEIKHTKIIIYALNQTVFVLTHRTLHQFIIAHLIKAK